MRKSCKGEEELGEVDGERMGSPRYSGVITGDELSMAVEISRIVLRSSDIDSLHSLIYASKR
jgi:hypothetical protein